MKKEDRGLASPDDDTYAQFAVFQEAIGEGATDPNFARHKYARLATDRALEARGVDQDGAEARVIRASVRTSLLGFSLLENRPAAGADIDQIVRRAAAAVDPEVDDAERPQVDDEGTS